MFKIHKYIHIISLNKKMKQQMLGFNFQSVFFSEVLGQLPPRKVAPWIIVPKEISFYYFVSPNNCIMLLSVLKHAVYVQALLKILFSMINPQSHSLETCVSRLCGYCKTFLLVPESTECTKVFLSKCSTLFVSPKMK